MGKMGCSLFWLVIIVWVLVVWAQSDPSVIVWIAVGALVAVLVVVTKSKTKDSSAKSLYGLMAAKLQALSKSLPQHSDVVMAMRQGEELVYKLPEVGLTQFRSSGSSYSGGRQGVSLRVAKGIYYNVGASRGSLQKNPETQQIVDKGSAIYTNQRIVFVGENLNQEWEFSKLLDVHVEPNGTSVSIAVSGKGKNAGLTWTTQTDITPGILTAIAHEYFNGGVEAAKKRCLEVADMMQRMAAGEKIEANI